MAYTRATWTPSSLQLRLALNSGNCRKSHVLLVRARVRRTLDREVRVLCVSKNGEERRPNKGTWNASDSSSDPLAGWSDSGNGEDSVESQRKESWFKGVLGAGVAGIILVAGLSFATLSLSKRNTSRLKQEMEPLTAQQEISLLSSDETPNDKIRLDESDANNVKLEDMSMKSNTDTDQELFLSSDDDGAPGKNKTSTDIENPSGIEATDNFSSQEKQETASVDVQTDSETTSSEKILSHPEALIGSSFTLPNLTDSESSLSANFAIPTSEIEDSPLNGKSITSSNSGNQDTKFQEKLPGSNSNGTPDLSLSSPADVDACATTKNVAVSISHSSELDSTSDPLFVPLDNTEPAVSTSTEENPDLNKSPQGSTERINISTAEVGRANVIDPQEIPTPVSAYTFEKEVKINGHDEISENRSLFDIPSHGSTASSAGIPAPSVAVQVNPGKIIVPAPVDQAHVQALAALQVLKVIDTDAQPSELCTRREYARWLVFASSALSRNTASKVYPAMYIENVTELAFDDITPEDPDFPSIQGLAEAGLIMSKLSNRDLLNDFQGPFLFFPESLLSRQDLVSWKMALEKRQLPETDKKMLYQLSGFIDIDKINPDAWPALVADVSTGEQAITALAFGCTRLFQPDKPVTKAQAAIALASGEASEIVSEELARIEAESMAENAVSAHNALVAQVEKDVNASFEKELSLERDKIDAVEKMAEQARLELEQLRAQREEENLTLLKERATIESEMEVFSRLRREVEEKLESLMSNKAEISYEKERLNKLRKEAEDEKQQISRLQYELEVERKALSMARSWAEDEAKRAREQAKALEEARKHWEMNGIKVVVDEDLLEESNTEVTWLNAGKQLSVEGTVNRAETLIDKLMALAKDVRGKSREVIDLIIQKILIWVSALKEWAQKASKRVEELKDETMLKSRGSVKELQQGATQLSLAVKDGVKRVADDCREGVGKLTQKFKS